MENVQLKIEFKFIKRLRRSVFSGLPQNLLLEKDKIKWLFKATSFKTLDVTAATYKQGNNVLTNLKKYVDALNNFNGRNWMGMNVKKGDISKKVLQVGVDVTKMTLRQAEQFKAAFEYAKTLGINFKLVHLK